MTDQTELQKIKDRIAKLLRMADDASSPNEAAIAASRARKLMDKYQLDIFSVGTGYEEEFGEAGVGRFYAALPQHMSIFCVAVAQYNDCIADLEYGEVTHRKSAKLSRLGTASRMQHRGARPRFKGYKSDVDLAVQMYDTLLNAVDRFRAEYLKDKGYDKYPVGIGKAFNLNAIGVLSSRLAAMTKEREAIGADEKAGTSLVVFKAAAVEAEFGAASYKQTKTEVMDCYASKKAAEAGRLAGHKIEITRQID